MLTYTGKGQVSVISYANRITGLAETDIFLADNNTTFANNIANMFNKWNTDLISFSNGTQLSQAQSDALTTINASNDGTSANYTIA